MSHPRVELWDAINRYVLSCGGDPSKHVYGNEARMRAVVAVDCAVDDLNAAAVRQVLDEAFNSGNGVYRP